jgi:hypothetical protein
MALVYSVLARCKTGDRDLAWIIGWVRERVDLRIESILLGGVGRSNMVGELRCAFPVVRGRMESSLADEGRRAVPVEGTGWLGVR